MQSAFLATKGTTSQRFDEKLQRIPVTTLLAQDVHLVEVKSADKQGYNALKLTIGTAKHIDKPTKGTLKKANIEHTPKTVKEVRIKGNETDRLEIVDDNGVKVVKVVKQLSHKVKRSQLLQCSK